MQAARELQRQLRQQDFDLYRPNPRMLPREFNPKMVSTEVSSICPEKDSTTSAPGKRRGRGKKAADSGSGGGQGTGGSSRGKARNAAMPSGPADEAPAGAARPGAAASPCSRWAAPGRGSSAAGRRQFARATGNDRHGPDRESTPAASRGSRWLSTTDCAAEVDQHTSGEHLLGRLGVDCDALNPEAAAAAQPMSLLEMAALNAGDIPDQQLDAALLCTAAEPHEQPDTHSQEMPAQKAVSKRTSAARNPKGVRKQVKNAAPLVAAHSEDELQPYKSHDGALPAECGTSDDELLAPVFETPAVVQVMTSMIISVTLQ